jgi:hypothetical protein
MVLSLLEKVYNNLEFEDRPKDSHLDLLNRAKILSWACRLDHGFCVYNAKSRYQNWMRQQHAEHDTGL